MIKIYLTNIMLVLYYLCYLLNNKIHLIYKELIVWLLNISISFALHLLTNTEKGTQLNQWQFQIYKMRMPLIADACFVLLDLSYHVSTVVKMLPSIWIAYQTKILRRNSKCVLRVISMYIPDPSIFLVLVFFPVETLSVDQMLQNPDSFWIILFFPSKLEKIKSDFGERNSGGISKGNVCH